MKQTSESDQFNVLIRHLFQNVYSFKYLYILFIVLSVAAAFLYNRYSPKVFEIYSTIGPVHDNPSSLLVSNEMFQGLEAYNSGGKIDDKINNLKSFSLISSTLSDLNFEVGYYTEKKSLFRQTTEMYPKSPFLVTIDKSHVQPISTKFYIYVLSESTFRLLSSKKKMPLYNYIDNQIVSEENNLEIDTICKFNETISNRYFKFSISYNKEFLPAKDNHNDLFYFELYHLDLLSKIYLGKLDIKAISFLASIISIKFSGENIEKSLTFLNKYINSFLEESLVKKNKIAVSTINFIDSQISEISDSLVISESKLRNFRTTNQVMDLSFQGQRIYEQVAQIETEKANLEVQKRYYDYILNNFKTNTDISGVVPPSSANIEDPIMNQLITDLVALNTERSGILSNKNEKNLFLNQIENKIRVQKQTIIENVTNNLNTLNLTLNELNYRTDKLSKEISKLPKTEMNMVNMQRKFNLNDVIYTFLLQKRSEAAITLASNYPDYEIIEPARAITSKIIAPKSKINYLISFFLAFLIPTMYIIIRDLLNNKISNVNDIEQIINRSVLGIIYSNNHKTDSVVASYPGSLIAESFRNLRSNLFFMLKAQSLKVLLITSSQPCDGKSFVSFNLAASIASVGYKTIIIDCDLRHPTLHNKFNEDNSSGLSTYMTRNALPDEIIHKTFIEHLSFIPAGPLLPNPAEMIESGVLDDLIKYLKNEYEYILIDTTPVGFVADANLIMKYASQILLISRNNFTQKDIFANVIHTLNSNKFDNYDVIYNDLNLKRSPYSKYSNYYNKEKNI